MTTHETIRLMTEGQRNEIIETCIGAIPSLNFYQAEAIISNKGPFVADIGEVFKQHAGKPTTAQSSSEFTIGGRTYELVPFLKNGESSVTGDTMMERAKELSANLGQEDGQFILEHQDEIPQEFRGKFYLVCCSTNPQDVAYFYWHDARWYQSWRWLYRIWYEKARLVRRRT